MSVLCVCVAAGAMAQAPPPPPPPAAPPPPEASDEVPRIGKILELDEYVGPPPESAEIPVSADTLSARTAPGSLLDQYRADPDYQYDSPEADGPTLWQRFMRWLGEKVLGPIFEGATSNGGQNILIVLAILLLGWVVMRLLRADLGPLFGRKDLTPEAGTSGPLMDVEDIREVDVATLHADALARGDFRDAVRFRYVLALQALANAGVIEWRRDKTNRDYVLEARTATGAPLAGPLADVTRAFDYVWYGERPVDGPRYARLEPLFDRFDDALGSRRQRPNAVGQTA